MILSEAKVRLAKAVDDVDNDSYDATELTDALKSVHGEAWTTALSGPRKYFRTTATVPASAAGVVDLTAYAPRKLIAVSQIQGQGRLFVMPARPEEAPFTYKLGASLEVVYIPDVVFPAADGTAFVWGTAAAMPSLSLQLDGLLIALAAQELKTKKNEVLAGLQARVDAKRQGVIDAIPSTSWSSLPLDSWTARRGRHTAPFKYIETAPHTLQLVLV